MDGNNTNNSVFRNSPVLDSTRNESEMEAKVLQTGNSVAEWMSVLDARDKLLRLHRNKQTDLATAKAVTGTCPDMCPEYERYFREVTNQLSPLEMEGNKKPDPHAMVKEYRRAGADQSEPLAHELRPIPVLMRTMDYLVCNIMDKAETDPSLTGEWFDFVWSRTRAIRKDITQQHLSDLKSVTLLEKCARFHIHCSATLCEEDLGVFDPKINDENLSKCIQSLKELYYDNSLKGLFCPNEDEFRCYDILLNLSESQILRDVKNYRNEIRSSQPVKFALSAYFAMAECDFVKFFSLVKRASYLNACLLHRYFNRVRLQAYHIIRRAYTSGTKSQQYPANLLLKNLGLETYEELEFFCDSISVELKDNFVTLSREHMDTLLSDLQARRSKTLVECKRRSTIGEVINAGPLPTNPYRKFDLHNSFDTTGKLKPEALEAEDQKAKTYFMLVKHGIVSNYDDNQSIIIPNVPIHVNTQETKRAFNPPVVNSFIQPNIQTDAEIKEAKMREDMLNRISIKIAEEIFNDVTSKYVKSTAFESYISNYSVKTTVSIVDEFVGRFVKYSCSQIFDEEKKELEKQKIMEQKNRIILAKTKEVFNQVLEKGFQNLVHEICKDVYDKELENYVKYHSERLSQYIMNEVVNGMISACAKNVFDEAIRKREGLINAMRQKRSIRLTRNAIELWKIKCYRSRRRQALKETFPASPLENRQATVPSLLLKRKSFVVEEEKKNDAKVKVFKQNNAYAPKLFEERVHRTCNSMNNYSNFSEIEELKRRLEREKRMTHSYTEFFETVSASYSFTKDSTENNDDDNNGD